MNTEQKTDAEKAWDIFLARATAENRNYAGEVVKENLNRMVNSMSPQQAVDALFKQANRSRRR